MELSLKSSEAVVPDGCRRVGLRGTIDVSTSDEMFVGVSADCQPMTKEDAASNIRAVAGRLQDANSRSGTPRISPGPLVLAENKTPQGHDEKTPVLTYVRDVETAHFAALAVKHAQTLSLGQRRPAR